MMPFENMLEIWLRFGHKERDFWNLTYRQFARWLNANFAGSSEFRRADLEALMARFPDVD